MPLALTMKEPLWAMISARYALMEWDLYTMCKLCGDWKTILIDFSPELIPACLGQNQCPQT